MNYEYSPSKEIEKEMQAIRLRTEKRFLLIIVFLSDLFIYLVLFLGKFPADPNVGPFITVLAASMPAVFLLRLLLDFLAPPGRQMPTAWIYRIIAIFCGICALIVLFRSTGYLP